jgi:hypothetical protein
MEVSNMGLSEKLKPCPFCKSNRLTLGEDDGRTMGWLRNYIHCERCPCNIYGYETKEEVIKAWNSRIDKER